MNMYIHTCIYIYAHIHLSIISNIYIIYIYIYIYVYIVSVSNIIYIVHPEYFSVQVYVRFETTNP